MFSELVYGIREAGKEGARYALILLLAGQILQRDQVDYYILNHKNPQTNLFEMLCVQ